MAEKKKDKARGIVQVVCDGCRGWYAPCSGVFASGSAGNDGGEWATKLTGSWEAVDDNCSDISRRWRNLCRKELVVMCVVPSLPLALSFSQKRFLDMYEPPQNLPNYFRCVVFFSDLSFLKREYFMEVRFSLMKRSLYTRALLMRNSVLWVILTYSSIFISNENFANDSKKRRTIFHARESKSYIITHIVRCCWIYSGIRTQVENFQTAKGMSCFSVKKMPWLVFGKPYFVGFTIQQRHGMLNKKKSDSF